MVCAPSEDSDQPEHPPSLFRVFAVRMKKAWVLSYLLNAQQRLWSDWADAQADLSLRWAHIRFFSVSSRAGPYMNSPRSTAIKESIFFVYFYRRFLFRNGENNFERVSSLDSVSVPHNFISILQNQTISTHYVWFSWSFTAHSTLLRSCRTCQLTYSHFSWIGLVLQPVHQYMCTYFRQ